MMKPYSVQELFRDVDEIVQSKYSGLTITSHGLNVPQRNNLSSKTYNVWSNGQLDQSKVFSALKEVAAIYGNDYIDLMRGEYFFAFNSDGSEYVALDAEEFFASTRHIYKLFDRLGITYDKKELQRVNRIANVQTAKESCRIGCKG